MSAIGAAARMARMPQLELVKRDRWQGLQRKSHFSKTQQRRGLTSRYPLHQGKKERAKHALAHA